MSKAQSVNDPWMRFVRDDHLFLPRHFDDIIDAMIDSCVCVFLRYDIYLFAYGTTIIHVKAK